MATVTLSTVLILSVVLSSSVLLTRRRTPRHAFTSSGDWVQIEGGFDHAPRGDAGVDVLVVADVDPHMARALPRFAEGQQIAGLELVGVLGHSVAHPGLLARRARKIHVEQAEDILHQPAA